jgi:hypothetical protein
MDQNEILVVNSSANPCNKYHHNLQVLLLACLPLHISCKEHIRTKLLANRKGVVIFQVGDFLLLHLLGQNLCSFEYRELLKDLSTMLNSRNVYPTVPYTLEMAPMSPPKEKYMKDTDA